jgi:ketosteroid isomerase-like protein
MREIAEKFEFHSYRPMNILVDGDHAAAELQVELTSRTTGQRFRARVAHFWSFEDGIPVSLVEYMDTALIASQIR